MKKIAIVSDAVYPFNKGGKEKRIHDITTRLAKDGWDVTIYCMKWWSESEKTIVRDGVKLSAISDYYPLYAGSRRSIREAIFFAFACLKLINKEFDVVDVDHMPHLVLFTMKIVCIIRRKPMIATWHEVWGKDYWKKYLGTTGIIAYLVERWSAKLPDVIIAVSQHTASDLQNVLKVRQTVMVVPNGLNIESISKNKPTQGADIIFAGRLLSHKNVDILLKAIAILKKDSPEITAFIVGEGPEKDNLQKLSAKLGLEKNVTFLGFLEDYNDLYQIMSGSSIFVLPSTREGFGIAALEANACGIPIIAIDHEHNATKDIIKNGETGMLVALDEFAMAKGIRDTLNTPKDSDIYRNHAKKYDWKNIIEQVKKIYAT